MEKYPTPWIVIFVSESTQREALSSLYRSQLFRSGLSGGSLQGRPYRIEAQLAYLGNSRNPGGDTGQRNRKGKATSNGDIVNPATTVGNWILISWRHSGKGAEHACQHSPTQWGKGTGAFIYQLPESLVEGCSQRVSLFSSSSLYGQHVLLHFLI